MPPKKTPVSKDDSASSKKRVIKKNDKEQKAQSKVQLLEQHQKVEDIGQKEKLEIKRGTKKVDKDDSILDHLAYLLQGNGECTAVFHDHINNKLIIAANSITSKTNINLGLYKHITEIIAFFNNKTKEDKEKDSTFLKITKELLNGLQQEDPYKYLPDQLSKVRFDQFIKDFFNNENIKDFAQKITDFKKIYGNEIAQQIIGKPSYIIHKAKHSFDKINTHISKKESFLSSLLNIENYEILTPDERSFASTTLQNLKNIQDNPHFESSDEFTRLKENIESKIKKTSVQATKESKTNQELQQAKEQRPDWIKFTMHIHAEMKILDYIMERLAQGNREGEARKKSFYVAASKLNCYDCHLVKKTVNKESHIHLEISSDAENNKDNTQSQYIETRGTHGLPFSDNWLPPKFIIEDQKILEQYLSSKSSAAPNKKGMQQFDSSYTTHSQHEDTASIQQHYKIPEDKISAKMLTKILNDILEKIDSIEDLRKTQQLFSLLKTEADSGSASRETIEQMLTSGLPDRLASCLSDILENFVIFESDKDFNVVDNKSDIQEALEQANLECFDKKLKALKNLGCGNCGIYAMLQAVDSQDSKRITEEQISAVRRKISGVVTKSQGADSQNEAIFNHLHEHQHELDLSVIKTYLALNLQGNIEANKRKLQNNDFDNEIRKKVIDLLQEEDIEQQKNSDNLPTIQEKYKSQMESVGKRYTKIENKLENQVSKETLNKEKEEEISRLQTIDKNSSLDDFKDFLKKSPEFLLETLLDKYKAQVEEQVKSVIQGYVNSKTELIQTINSAQTLGELITAVAELRGELNKLCVVTFKIILEEHTKDNNWDNPIFKAYVQYVSDSSSEGVPAYIKELIKNWKTFSNEEKQEICAHILKKADIEKVPNILPEYQKHILTSDAWLTNDEINAYLFFEKGYFLSESDQINGQKTAIHFKSFKKNEGNGNIQNIFLLNSDNIHWEALKENVLQGSEKYAEAKPIDYINPYFGKYTLNALENILKLRLEDLKNDYVKKQYQSFSNNAYKSSDLCESSVIQKDLNKIFDSGIKTMHGVFLTQEHNNIVELLSNIVNADSQTTLVPLNLFNKHAAGLIFERNKDNAFKVKYIDPENKEIPKEVLSLIKTILDKNNVLFNENIDYNQIIIGQQKYANCGPEVIENFILYLAGKRVAQEKAIELHSKLVENALLGIKYSGVHLLFEELTDNSHSIENHLDQNLCHNFDYVISQQIELIGQDHHDTI